MSAAIAAPDIVKLGAAASRAWLAAIADGGGQAVLVPGGGAFADAVRASQARLGFDDGAAHEMALLAMAATARGFVSLEPRLRLAATPREIVAARRMGLTPVWAPAHMTLGRVDLRESWDVASDALAAWLAGELGAARVILVKAVRTAERRLDALTQAGVVDRGFAAMLARGRARGYLLGPGDEARLAAALADRPPAALCERALRP